MADLTTGDGVSDLRRRSRTGQAVSETGERLKAVEIWTEMHDKECARRYGELKTSMTGVETKIDGIVATQLLAQGQADRPKWWVPIVSTTVGVIFAGLIGLIGWLFGQVLADQNAKIEAALRRATPSQTVTVNPSTQTATPAALADPSLPVS